MTAYVLVFCQVVVGSVFVLSVWGKLRDIKAFEEAIRGFQLVPAALIRPATITFVVGEMVIVVMLVVGGPLLLAGFVLAGALLVLFSGALLSVLQRKLDVSCGCFGATDQRVSYYDIVRNGGFILCAAIGGWVATTPIQAGLESLLLVGGAVAFVLIWTNLQDIVHVLRLESEIE